MKISTSNLGISEDIKELSPFDKENSEEPDISDEFVGVQQIEV